MRAAAEALDRPCGRVQYSQARFQIIANGFGLPGPSPLGIPLWALQRKIARFPCPAARFFGSRRSSAIVARYLQLTASITELCTPRESVFAELTSNPRASSEGNSTRRRSTANLRERKSARAIATQNAPAQRRRSQSRGAASNRDAPV